MDISDKEFKIHSMNAEKDKLKYKKISTAKSILAALWHLKEAGRQDVFSHRYVKLLCQDKNKTTYRSCISRLNSQNIIKKDYNNIISLTDRGKREAMLAFIQAELALHSQGEGKWDGGWRMIFFDIPESKRRYRDYLRRVIRVVGFHEFQRSIWIYPYPVPEFLKNLLFEENIKPHVRFITTDLIDDDTDLRKIFNLPCKT